MKFGNIEIGDKPSLEQLTKFMWTKRLNISSRKMFDYYEEHHWLGRNGNPIGYLDCAIAGINNCSYRYQNLSPCFRKISPLRDQAKLPYRTSP